MKKVPLGDFMVSRPGSVLPSNYPEESFELYSIPAHDRGGPEVLPGAAIGSAKQVVRPGDVMVSKIIPHLRRSRVVAERNGRRQVASGEWIVFRSDRFLPAYLRHYLVSDVFHSQFMNTVAGVGGSLVRARPEHVRAIPVPLPTLEEQRRIAAILDKADAIRAKRRQVLAHLDALTQSIFHDMFGDGAGEVLPLGVVVTRIDSGTSPVCEPRPAMAAEWGVLKLSAVTRGVFNAEENKAFLGEVGPMKANEVRSGDVLMTRKNTRELVGAVALVENVRPRLLLPDLVFRLRLDQEKVDARYFQTLLMTPSVRVAVQRLSGGSAGSMPNISKERLRALPLPIPPLERQRGFAARFRVIAEQRTAISAELSKLNALFAALQSRAFNGEL